MPGTPAAIFLPLVLMIGNSVGRKFIALQRAAFVCILELHNVVLTLYPQLSQW